MLWFTPPLMLAVHAPTDASTLLVLTGAFFFQDFLGEGCYKRLMSYLGTILVIVTHVTMAETESDVFMTGNLCREDETFCTRPLPGCSADHLFFPRGLRCVIVTGGRIGMAG